MEHNAIERAASGGAHSSPVFIVFMCLFLIMGLIQVIRPQLLWRINSRMQRGWVKNPEGTEPTGKGYAMQRVTGVIFMVFATWMLVQNI
ncbi:DUF6199 family natural product biosynthesis protein [Streptomyces sp. NPDC014846]|uniref:DUF6199 family natural product biosynthesis protein n=1 Tax=Streptomyces sp. NPDC014846 TaxID=3364922 RepID=UPI0036FE0C51